MFGGISVGDTVTVDNERSSFDGARGQVVGAARGQLEVSMFVNGDLRTLRFFPYELTRG